MDDLWLSRQASRERARDVAERELEIGRQIQASFLPRTLPQPSGWEIAARFEAAREVAGDFYDAFPLAGGKRIGLVVGDVCDKGVGAALFMALFRSLIRAFADQHYSLGWMDVLASDGATGKAMGAERQDARQKPGSVGRRRELLAPGTTALKKAMDLTNDYIARNHGDSNMFATLFFGVLDPASGILTYINGGHEPPLLIGQAGIRARLGPTGPAVGLFPGVDFAIDQILLAERDTLLAFTDGVPDTLSPADEPFGNLRLEKLARKAAGTADQMLEAILNQLENHMSGKQQFDDITLLALRRADPAMEPSG